VDSRARAVLAIDGALASAPAHFTPAAGTIAQGAIAPIAPSLDDEVFDFSPERSRAGSSAGHAPCIASARRASRVDPPRKARARKMIDDATCSLNATSIETHLGPARPN